MKKTPAILLASFAAVALSGCAWMMSAPDPDIVAAQMVKEAFRTEGIATVERVTQIDETLKLCNAADVAGKPLDAATAKRIEEANLRTVKWPTDGKFIGDWKRGEQIAQSGRGLTWTDAAMGANGGNCYNCHQISKEEISFGTIGPSLYHYGKLRGVADPANPSSKAIVDYTWGKIWNAKAYNACSNMPRSGHMGNLTEAQIKDIMALLLDPASPVNK